MTNGEIVIIIGLPGSGKTTVSQQYVEQGYHRLNRDIERGKVQSLLPKLELVYRQGKRHFVLDNLYGSPTSRRPVVEMGEKLGLPVGCLVMTTSIEDAQFNVCRRIIASNGRILSPDEMKKSKDPGVVPPVTLFAYRKQYIAPTTSEGFAWIRYHQFSRNNNPEFTNKALILDADGTLRRTRNGEKYPRSIDEMEVLTERADKLKEMQQRGYKLLGISNQSGVAKGELSIVTCREIFAEMNRQLGVEIDWRFCPHTIPPFSCYCRKPAPGLFVELQEQYKLDVKQSLYVGDMKSDATFANRCGLKYIDQSTFFG